MGAENECIDSDKCEGDVWSTPFNDNEDAGSIGPFHSDRLTVSNNNSAVTTSTSNISCNTQRQETSYTSKKPLWWKRQSGRKISSRQRLAIQEIQELGLQLKLPVTITKKHDSSMENIKSDNNDSNDQDACLRSCVPVSLPPVPVVPTGNRPRIEWHSVFPSYNSSSGDEIWLEIGFGLGDNLLCLASANPVESINTNGIPKCRKDQCTGRKFYIGAEMHKGGVGTICTRIQSANQENKYWTDFTLFDSSVDSVSNIKRSNASESAAPLYGHVRIYMGDGIKLLPFIPDHSISAVLITFPDPFMGTNQSSFRILQLDVLDQIRRVLVCPEQVTMSDITGNPSGRLYLATDHLGYHEWSHDQVSKFNSQNIRNSKPENANLNTELDKVDKAHFYDSSKGRIATFRTVDPTPDRSLWLPAVSKYEQKGYDEGRKTYLSCWEIMESTF